MNIQRSRFLVNNFRLFVMVEIDLRQHFIVSQSLYGQSVAIIFNLVFLLGLTQFCIVDRPSPEQQLWVKSERASRFYG